MVDSWHPSPVEGRCGLHLGLQGAHVAAALVVVSSRRRHAMDDAATADAEEVPRPVAGAGAGAASASAALAELHLVLAVAQPRIKHPRARDAAAVGAAEHGGGVDAAAGEGVHQVVEVRVALVHVLRRRPHVRRRADEATEHGARAVRARRRAHLRRLLEESRRRHLRQHRRLIVVEPCRRNMVATNEVTAEDPRRRRVRTAAAACTTAELVIAHQPLAGMLMARPRAVAVVGEEAEVEEGRSRRAGAPGAIALEVGQLHEAMERLGLQERVLPIASVVAEILPSRRRRRGGVEEERRLRGAEGRRARRRQQVVEPRGDAAPAAGPAATARAAEAAQRGGRVVVVAAAVLERGGEVGAHLGEAERHVPGVAGAVQVAGEAAEARRRQPGALLRQRVAERPVRDEAVPPARAMDTSTQAFSKTKQKEKKS